MTIGIQSRTGTRKNVIHCLFRLLKFYYYYFFLGGGGGCTISVNYGKKM